MPKDELENTTGKRSGGVIVNQDEIDELQASATFSSSLLISTYTERPFFYFRNQGDSVEGVLGLQHCNTNIRRCPSRVIMTKTGPQDFFVNRQLSALLKKRRLEGKYIRVTYIGQERTGWGHRRKCYQVETFTTPESEKITRRTGTPGTKTKRGSK